MDRRFGVKIMPVFIMAKNGLGLSVVLANKSQTSGHNGLSPIELCPLFRLEVCDLFTDTILKLSPLCSTLLFIYSLSCYPIIQVEIRK